MALELFAVPFALTLVLLCIIERSMNAIISIFIYSTPWKKLASQQMIVKNVDMISSIGSVFVTTFVKGVFYLVSWWVLFLTLFTFFSSLYILYEENSGIVVSLFNFYNASVGPWLSKVVLAPLILLDVVMKGLLPIYNSILYWFKALFLDVFLQTLLDDVAVFLKMGTVLLNLCANLSLSVRDFAQTFYCKGVDCLVPEPRVLNCISFMGNVRQFGALTVQLFSNICGFMAVPIDMLLFPLMDMNLSNFVHNFINSIFQLFFVIPHTTYVRCKMASNDTFHDILCTPDAEPFFTYLAASFSDLGLLFDNWLNVILVIIEGVFLGSSPQCSSLPNALSPHTVMYDPLFKSNLTTIVGLTQWMYAVTDGYLAFYTGHNDLDAKMQDWPYPIDPSFGVAAVVYSPSGEMDASSLSEGRTVGSLQTTSMMGCRCNDLLGGIEIECTILPFNGIPSDKSLYNLQVLFPAEDAQYQMGQCGDVEISVHSSRWSLRRYETKTITYGVSTVDVTIPSGDCISRNTCRDVDAIVYVQPKCVNTIGCLPTSYCFPYCMAARVSGSANNNLILVGAERWRSGYSLIQQDCALDDGSVQSTHSNIFSSGTQTTVLSQPNILTLNSKSTVMVGSQSRVCKPSSKTASFVDKETVGVRLSGQPFIVAGEFTLTEKTIGLGFSTVIVERLVGNQRNVFTMDAINELPASQPLAVQRREFVNDNPDHILIPFSTYYNRMPAVTSRNHLFYASNPALDCFRAQIEYCSNRKANIDDLPEIGFLLRSSYAPIRVYRLRGFTRCTKCDNLVRFVQFDGYNDATFSPKCNQVFNASITAIEYLNEDNIVVIVHSTIESEYDFNLGRGVGPNSKYTTYFLHPTTMQIQTTPWTNKVPESNYGVLCPALQRLPRAGTFVAELLNAFVFSVRYVVNIIMYSPGLWKIWIAGGQCPTISLYHSVLGNCGDDFISLEDVFDSLEDSATVFWHSLTLLAQATSNSNTNPVSNVLTGMSAYGTAAIDVWGIRQMVLTFNKVPLDDQITNMIASFKNMVGSRSAMINTALKVNTGIIAWQRFTYKAISTVVLECLKLLANTQSVTETKLYQVFWSAIYDLHPYYTATITKNNRMACAGLRTMFGIDNPYAKIIYYQCLSGGELLDDTVKFVLTLFVDLPMVHCVCKESTGASDTSIRRFVQNTCAPRLPPTLRPLLYMMVNQLQSPTSGFRQLSCKSVVGILKTDLEDSYSNWFEAQTQSYGAMANSIDWLTGMWDEKNGQCLNYDGNPHVVVIMPQPAEYFSLCAKTSLCKAQCSKLWYEFQSRSRTPIQLPNLEVTTESYFFPGSLDKNLILSNAVAVIEVEPTMCNPSTPKDYALAVAEYTSKSIASKIYCIPQNPGATVYPTQYGFGPISLPGTVIQVHYTNTTANMLALLIRMGDVNSVYLAQRSGLTELPSVESRLPSTQKLVQTLNLYIIHNFLLIDVVAREFDDALTTAVELHYITNPNSNNIVWSSTDINLIPFENYWFTREYNSDSYLFLPKQEALNPYRIVFTKFGSFVRISSINPLQDFIWSSYSTNLLNYLLSPSTTQPNSLFAVSNQGWDWLKHVRLDGKGAFNSLPITTTLITRGNCDEISCEGCSDLITQRLCLAYNRCALMNCVGTPINMRRPLCGMGGMLKFFGELFLQTLKGAWVMVVEIIYKGVALDTIKTSNLNIEFPDDTFLGYMCVAKDANANLISIITSTLNSLLKIGGAKMTYLYQGASNVDNNADAMLTVTMTAVTTFIHQTFLYPAYVMASFYQIMTCKINGILSLIDQSGFTIRLESAELTNQSSMAGKCLTLGDMMQARYPAQNKESIGYQVSTFMQNVMNMQILSKMDIIVHMLDGILSYFQGWFHSLGQLILTQYMAQCNPPEHLLKDIATCACGDTPLQIKDRTKTYKEYAHWCSGTLGMVDGNNQPFVVFNPWSYEELQQVSNDMASYLECASTSYKCSPPTQEEFSFQGVTLLNVLVKCRENYVKKQWDPMAYVLYDKSKSNLFKTKIPLSYNNNDIMGIKSCLINNPTNNQPCLELYLSNSQDNYDSYFAYHRIPSETRVQYMDACLTFDGPNKAGSSQFSNCVDGINEEQCTIPGHLWTPDSLNNVPIAYEHIVTYDGANPDSLIFQLYNRANKLVLSSLKIAEDRWMNEIQDLIDYEFFSAEGDIIHQILDCIFLGPYSRVDYWPIPHCDGLDCPNGPYWSRDVSGNTRLVDVETCINTSSIPYSCGSPSRRALIKYFVKEYLTLGNRGNTNGTILQQAVRAQLTQLRKVWELPYYGCECGNVISHTCCKNVSDNQLLSSSLNQDYIELKSDHVMNVLQTQFEDFYDHILQSQLPWVKYLDEVAPGEINTYDWSNSARAVGEARFHPKKTVIEYNGSEVLSPFEKNQPHTLWDICHASLKQTFWTMPMQSSGKLFEEQLTNLASIILDMGGRDAIPASVGGREGGRDPRALLNELLSQSFDKSPLYRHYIARYLPSDSLVCKHEPIFTEIENIGYEDYIQKTSKGDALLLEGDELETFPVFHKDRFAIGARECFCGWRRISNMCEAPIQGCDKVKALTKRVDCLYDESMEVSVVELYVEGIWDCPETDFSAHWGILDIDAQDRWMSGSSVNFTRSKDVLEYGRVGVRVGNMKTLKQEAKTFINPNKRVVDKRQYSLNCDVNFVNDFVDELFPMAQGVEESGAGSYCLRMVIEEIRLLILENVLGLDHVESTKQRAVSETWKKRCGSQLQLLQLCKNLDVFFRQPNNLFERCEHFTFVPGALYVTPECLVAYQNNFYDPCRCLDCDGNRTVMVDLSYLISNPSCKLRFNPLEIIKDGPIGFWENNDNFKILNDFKNNNNNILINNINNLFLNEGDNFGNVEDNHNWWDAEGFMKDNSEYCDMISDYWPEDLDYPIGYHVSVGCDVEDIAYRSFHKAFGLEFENGDPVLRYQHDTLRDDEIIDNYFGESGLCRGTMFGIPLTNTNTMRYSTRVELDETADYTVYSTKSDATSFTEWQTSQSSTELPWPDYTINNIGGATYSIGLLPNMPPPNSDFYPYDLELGTFEVGPHQDLDGWGDSCSDYSLTYCLLDSECPTNYRCRGRFCAGTMDSCTSHSQCSNNNCRGVCMDSKFVSCIKHSECPSGQMCSGIGTCLPLRISVQNTDSTLSYTFKVSTKSSTCGENSNTFSLLGGSYWGWVTNDVVRMHGMCSYTEWYKFIKMFERCKYTSTSLYYEIDPLSCRLMDLETNLINSTYWWNPQNSRPDVMYIHPSNCDRDYERLSGFTQCSPKNQKLKCTHTNEFVDLTYEQYAKTYTDDKKIRLAKFDITKPKYGFIKPDILTDANFNDITFSQCSRIRQCYAFPFKHKGVEIQRQMRLTTLKVYNDDDTFQCGSIGYVSGNQCLLDLDVLGMYRFFCVELPTVRSKCNNLIPNRNSLCSAISQQYSAGYSNIQTNVDALRSLLQGVPTPITPDEYLQTTECMVQFYDYLQPKLYQSLYYPFDFALQEIPFDWFFQCLVMADTTINPSNRLSQDCVAYQLKDRFGKENYEPPTVSGDDIMTFLRFVRGGYTLSQVEQYKNNSKKIIENNVKNSINYVINSLFSGIDTSYPQCSINVIWKIGQGYTYVSPYRAIIQTYYDTGTCHLQWLESQISRQSTLSSSDWYDLLSEPDPIFKIPQTNGGDTLLNHIQDFVLENMQPKAANLILGSNRLNNPPPLTTRREGFVFDTSFPQPELLLLRVKDFYLPLYQGEDSDSIVTFDNLEVPHVCAFDDPYDDPKQTGISYQPGQCSTQPRVRGKLTDQLRRCNNVFCSEVPKYYKIRGKFGCGYYPTLFNIDCNEKTLNDFGDMSCADNYLFKLYEEVKKVYIPPVVENLKVQDLPWFTNSISFSFVLNSILNYLGNIMPDKEKSLMCQVGSNVLDLMQCSNDNYNKLKSHVNTQYFKDGSPIIIPNHQLDWDVHGDVLQMGSIFAFSTTKKDPAQTFLKNMFTDSSVCQGTTTFDDRICWKSGSGNWNSMNPWLLGNWNPFEKCDVNFLSKARGGDEVISSRCETCSITDPYYTNMPNSATCSNNNKKKVLLGGVPPNDEFGYLDYNLCHHTITQDEEGCLHDQSLLGGYDGHEVGALTSLSKMTDGTIYDGDFQVSNSMYEPSQWVIPSDFENGLFSNTNPLFESKESPYGYLRSPPTDIGLHHLQFKISYNGNYSVLELLNIPLHINYRNLDMLYDKSLFPPSTWVSTLQSSFSKEDSENQKLYSITYQNSISASCPLKRFAFYGSNHPTFNPVMPSPLRAKHLFRILNKNQLSHPLMTKTVDGFSLGSYKTSNGFCFCPVVNGVKQRQCLRSILGDQSMCSLQNTISLLRGIGIGQSYVYKPKNTNLMDTPCTMMLDWPNLPNPLRDNSQINVDWTGASDPKSKKCHILDRFTPFQYRYESVSVFPTKAQSYLQNACQTARVATLAFKTGRCVTESRQSSQLFLKCGGGDLRTLQRVDILSPPQTVAKKNFQRRLCNKCSPLPKFKSEKGKLIRPESSFGRHYRESVERNLARDLKSTLCNVTGKCPELNETAWRKGEFIKNFFYFPNLLFLNQNFTVKKYNTNMDDSSNWETSWVFCPDIPSLKNGKCIGKISRNQWSKGKTTICPRLIKQLSKDGTQDPMAKTSFCRLDNTTDQLCKSITQAKALIMEANCIARGKNLSCLPQPWVYHPANYDPTNQEWNYKTVLNFYRMVNSTACPLTTQEKEMISANKVFQRSCPANSIIMFEVIIKILRIIVTKLAMLGSAVASIFIRTCVFLIATANPIWSSTVQTAKADIAADWAWVKKEGQVMLNSITDLFTDALFTSGQLGKALLEFLNTVCYNINDLYEWLMDTWCEHIQKYMVQFLQVVRKGFGLVAAGFEMLQDFMDEILAGVLPMGMWAKYGDKKFQKKMTEKYSQPSKSKNNKVAINIAEKSAERAGKQAAKQGKVAGRMGKAAGAAGAVLSAAMFAFEMYETIQGALLYPDNFTLFDFDEVFDKIDFFLEFLVDERTCYMRMVRKKNNMDQSKFMQCFDSKLSSVDSSNADAINIDATPCWAQALPSLGQSTLFSCNTGSTCCKDAFCTEFTICDTCPSVNNDMVLRYGCNSLSQKCQCLVDRGRYSQCLRNSECNNAMCLMMTSLDGISYGTVPCNNCPGGNTFCMVNSAGPGKCTCLLDQGSTRALCGERSGEKTMADGSKLCGYKSSALETDSSFSYEYEDLAMVPCIQAFIVVCSSVYYKDNTNVRMSVALPPLRFSGRRLLSMPTQDFVYESQYEFNDPVFIRKVMGWNGWNNTAAPCSVLAHLYQTSNGTYHFGVLEEMALHQCVYWRYVGRQIIYNLNLTNLKEHDTFLLSIDDFSSAITNKDVVTTLLKNPMIFFKAFLYHPYLKPVKTFFKLTEGIIDQMTVKDVKNQWLNEVIGDLPSYEWEDLRKNRTIFVKLQRNVSKNSRKLMGLQDELNSVNGLLKSFQQVSTDIPSVERVSEAYTRGPFHWPPDQNINSDCVIGSRLVDITYDTFVILGLYYQNWNKEKRVIDRSFKNALPNIYWKSKNATQSKNWAGYAFYGFLSFFGAVPSDSLVFFQGTEPWTLRWIYHSFTRCDLAVVQSCSGHKRDLVMSIFVFFIFYLILVMISNSFGIPYISFIFLLSSPILIIWYVYGVGIGCFPLIPTCFVEDLIHAGERFMPGTLKFPTKLLCNESHAKLNFLPPNACLKSCESLNFTGWTEPIAFTICDLDENMCRFWGNFSTNITSIDREIGNILLPFKNSLQRFSKKDEYWDAFRVCSYVTFVTTIPVLALVISFFLLLSSFILGVIQLGPVFFSMMAQSMAYHRTE